MIHSKSFLPKELADATVMEFKPQAISLGTPQPALDHLQRKPGSDFRMNESVQVYTGIDRIEEVNDAERVEKRALEMLAEIQQNAYQEAYNLGLDEGRKRAFEEKSSDIATQMGQLEQLIAALTNLKAELLSQNESHLMKLLFHMAERITMTHLEKDNEAVVEVLRSAVALAQTEENIRVEMSPQQIEFIEELRKQTGREVEFLRKIRFEPNAEMKPGGCVIETNYGEIDARIETRLQKLWETLSEALPKVKDKLTG